MPKLSLPIVAITLRLISGAIAVLTLVAFLGPFWYRADLFAQFRVQLFISAAAAALCSALLSYQRAALVAALAALINGAILLPHFWPDKKLRPVGSGHRHVIRCVSSNVLQGNKELPKLETFIRQSQADLLVFQEVTPEIAETLQRTSDLYPAQFLLPKRDSKGTALLTRLPARGLRFEGFSDGQIGAVTGQVQVGQQWVTVFGIHSHKPTSASGAQSQQHYFPWLAQLAEDTQRQGPVILMGDFNCTPWAAAWNHFGRHSTLLDTRKGTIFAATWSVQQPSRLLIDHAFVSPHFQLLQRRIGPDVGSDHRPLLIDLQLAPATP